MVDRITPVTTSADRDHLEVGFGLIDRCPVVAEPFRQWALEDDFAAGRPRFEDVDVLFTDDVHAWELYKLRFLNAGHTAIAYLSALAGVTHVDEAATDPHIGPFLSALLLDEAMGAVDPIPGHPREQYVATVLERFANTGVRDQVARLCADGTSKVANFLIPTVGAQVANGGRVELCALALAGWAHYLSDLPEDAQARDDHAGPSRELARAALADPGLFLVGNEVLPEAVALDARFGEAFARAHRLITEIGPLAAIDASVARRGG
jgi:mannitol 2-dehydrogenase